MSIRAEKVSSLIKRVLAKPIDLLASEHNAGLVTVTSVRLTEDLQTAKVYISIFGDKISPGKFLAILEDKKGSLRTQLGKEIRLRYTPDLKFFLDDTLDKIEHIQELINSIGNNKKEIFVNPDDYDPKSLPKD
ncbi:30S ribosome-binding factor RbfA [Bacteroidetes/Chlorobi group bacterium ChocPot_Mid]|jgi:ribosome-binding factor A|nr:MAG: 30S ribosome-binding factor RbfA [Bacteroidetes/Chlorobi group bacterium ChocPot_Mid]